jgi:hypothetical protein
MGGEALGPVKAQCPNVEELEGGKMGVSRWVGEHPHRSRGRAWVRGLLREPGKGITFEM